MENKLPQQIFVTRKNDGDDYDWLLAEEDVEGLIENNDDEIVVGVYKLVELQKVSLKVVRKVITKKVKQ